MSSPPTVRGIKFRLGWPPVTIAEREERRREHLQMAAVLGLATGLIFATEIPGVLAALTAFIGGYAVNNWLSWELMYDDVEEVNA